MDFNFLHELITPSQTKIVMLIMDGLGGVPLETGGKTELEAARTPNLDTLAVSSALGLSVPVGPGITVESGPGHLALFGYDPLKYRMGRGVLEALGIDLELIPGDIAMRGNYCIMDETGIVVDRRAGRIADDISKKLSNQLTTRIEDVDFFVRTVREHRLAIVMRGPGLSADISGTDPLKNGHSPLPLRPLSPIAEHTARLLNLFLERSKRVMEEYSPKPIANMLLVRGIDGYPHFPQFHNIYGLQAGAIAVYPTYRGIARLVGMQVLKVDGVTHLSEFTTLEKHWNAFDFFYLHIKETDLAGEDGDFDRKVEVIEEVDGLLPHLMALQPDVLIVGGDHSTPAALRGHSWHPVPTLIYSKYIRADGIKEFGENACARGSLGVFPAMHIMPIALANANRIMKWSG